MIFDGIEKDYVRVNRELFRPLTAPIEFYTRDKVRGGAKTRKKRLKDFILPVPVTIKSPTTIEDLKQDISNWLVHKEPKKLIFKDKPNRYYLAEFESMTLNEKIRHAKGVINFYLAEGCRFGEDKTLNLTTTLKSFTISGQLPAQWTSTTQFTVPQSSFTLENNNGGKIILNYDFIAGDVLVIDSDKRDVFLNGVDLAVSIAMDTVWFDLPVGQISMEASRPTELTYTERYY